MSVPVTLETAIPAGQSAHRRPAVNAAPRPKIARAVPYTAAVASAPDATPIILTASRPPPKA